ncbi:MAG: SDR family NAD(P)-dependent oxidoreductase [Clostridia bacterium]|nr:SDR family NAD(P)-dependent oxidoreductase [Clostridia bacterium]
MEKYTLITGATGGLGKAFTNECLKRGDNLVLTGTKEAVLKSIVEDINTNYPQIKVLAKTCDLSSESDRKSFFDFLKENNAQINFLINNAGFIAEGEFLKHPDQEIMKIIRVNCEGTTDFTQKVIKARDENEDLHIITVSSMAGDYPMPYMAIYSATKAMLTTLMVALNYELKDKRVYITTVCPSGIPTTDAMKEAIKSQGAGGRMTMCTPEKVAMLSMKASKKHKVVYVPKVINKFIKGISKLCKETTLARIVGKRWKKSQAKRNFNTEGK